MLHNTRYKDKKVLSEYDLNIDLLEVYDFKVYDLIPVRKVFILITDKGDKILKKLDCDVKDIMFINDGVEYIRKNGFNRVFNFTKTKKNQVYIRSGKDLYCVMDLINGRESEYSNPIDVMVASTGVAELHKASEGFKCPNKKRDSYGNLINEFKRRVEEMELFKSLAMLSENKSGFDEIFLEEFNSCKKQMERSIDILETSAYYKLCSEEDKKVLCHHDLAHHNVLIKEDKAYFVDFDYSIIDLKVHDLCNFINKVCKSTGYDIERTKSILDNYSEHNNLSKSELEVLYGMLVFPQDFYTISKNYYTKTKNWDYNMFLQKMIKKNDYKEDREEFIARFTEFV